MNDHPKDCPCYACYKPQNQPMECDAPVNQCSREPTARELLEQRRIAMALEASQMQVLLDCLPATLPYHADRALKNLIFRPHH